MGRMVAIPQPNTGIHSNSRFRIQTWGGNNNWMLRVSQADWCLHRMTAGGPAACSSPWNRAVIPQATRNHHRLKRAQFDIRRKRAGNGTGNNAKAMGTAMRTDNPNPR